MTADRVFAIAAEQSEHVALDQSALACGAKFVADVEP